MRTQSTAPPPPSGRDPFPFHTELNSVTTRTRSQYIQNVRNNKTHKRTPKWAIRAGLVKMKDPRAGRHQWANRYEGACRLPATGPLPKSDCELTGTRLLAHDDVNSAERVGGDDTDSLRSQSWDGRGPEPQRGVKPLGGNRKSRHTLSPWDDYVDADEVEGGADGDGLYRVESRRFRDDNSDLPAGRTSAAAAAEPEADPLTNEQFYPAPAPAPLRPTATGGGKKKFGSGLLKHRSRYAEQPFDTTDAVSSRTRGSDGYQDEFEREINEEARAGAGGRFDSFEAEGPEDPWAAPAPPVPSAAVGSNNYEYANGSGNGASSQAPLRPQKTGRAEETDGDCACHLSSFSSPTPRMTAPVRILTYEGPPACIPQSADS